MAKIVRIPLVMKNGEKATDMKSLKDNFDIESVCGFFLDGKLEKWLTDRYYEDEAEAVSQLSKDDSQLAWKLCEIFGVEHEEDVPINTEEIAKRNERIARLKQLTDDDEILQNVDLVAFNQEELAELYDQGAEKIYLCEGSFKIPKSKQSLEYVPALGADVVGLPEKEPAVSAEEGTSENWAPAIIRFRHNYDAGETIDKIPFEYEFKCYCIVNEVPADFSKYDKPLLYAGYTKRHLVFADRRHVIILDRKTGQIEDLSHGYRSRLNSRIFLINGTDDYLLIYDSDCFWLYDVNHRTQTNLAKKFESYGPFASLGERSAYGISKSGEDFRIAVINLHTGEMECTVSVPRRYRVANILMVDSGFYCAFNDSYGEADAEVYFYEYSTQKVRKVCSFPDEDIRVSIMGSYAEKVYVKTYTKETSDTGETSIYEISGLKVERTVFSGETYEGEDDYCMPHYAFTKRDPSTWRKDIVVVNIASGDQRKIASVSEDAMFGCSMYIEDSTLYFTRQEEDEDGDDEDVGYCVDLSDPNSEEKTCENPVLRTGRIFRKKF